MLPRQLQQSSNQLQSLLSMADVTLRSYDPFAYYVNNVSDLDREVVAAHRNNDVQKKKELLSRAKSDFDVFICINKHNHAFVLCVPCGPVDADHPLGGALSRDPSDIPELQLCWQFELCFENQQLRMYKVRKQAGLFKDIKERIHKSYHVGTFKDMATIALQFAALRSAPHRYGAILNDCVEYSKEFCICLLNYCSNWRELEQQVNQRIKDASATGLSVERLSRNVRMSGLIGNISLQLVDVSSFIAQKGVLVVAICIIYPIVVALIVSLIVVYVSN